jgi:hypothetical protein
VKGEIHVAGKEAGERVHELWGKRSARGQEPETHRVGNLERTPEQHQADLKKIRDGKVATGVRILAHYDCCPVCRALEGAYGFEDVPALPAEGCSHPEGCRCYYAPILDMFGP